MTRVTKKRIDALQHYVDTTVGLWCIDRNPKDVTKEWIEENAFQLTAPFTDKKFKKKTGKTKMLATGRTIIEIKTHSKDEVVAKIADALEKHPGSLRLDGGINMHTCDEDILLDFGMERPDTQRVHESFAKLPASADFDGLLLLTTYRRYELV